MTTTTTPPREGLGPLLFGFFPIRRITPATGPTNFSVIEAVPQGATAA